MCGSRLATTESSYIYTCIVFLKHVHFGGTQIYFIISSIQNIHILYFRCACMHAQLINSELKKGLLYSISQINRVKIISVLYLNTNVSLHVQYMYNVHVCSGRAGGYVTTVFIDMWLWKTKHLQKGFQNFHQSYVLSTDRIEIHQSKPASMT